jgi:hypothetical protein
MAKKRKTYRSKRAALRAAHGSEVYSVKGPPRGWRISRGKKVRGKRGKERARNKRRRAAKRRTTKRKTTKRRKKKRVKRIKWIKVKMGNPNPEVCGYG